MGAAAPAAFGDEWPQWRGPQRDGVWRETGIIDRFASDHIPHRWSAPIGPGYSGPTVADGRVYVTDRLTEPREVERVHCFDRKTGERLWTHAYGCAYHDIDYRAGPRASVLIDAGRAYALGAMGHLHCLDAATGEVLWARDLNERYDIRMPNWGIAASPLIEGELLIVQIGGAGEACLVAMDKRTGEQRWTALGDRANYSAPIVIDQAGRRILVCWTGDRIVGVDPSTGELHWAHPHPPRNMPLGVASPVFHRGYLFFTGFYDGSVLLRVASDRLAVEQVYHRRGTSERRSDALHSIISTPHLEGGYVYGVDSYGELRCLELSSGDRIWEDATATVQDRWSTIHFIGRPDDTTWLFNEQGELIIARLSPEGFEQISRASLIEPTGEQLRRRPVAWSHPAFAYRHVFARNDERLICADLSAP